MLVLRGNGKVMGVRQEEDGVAILATGKIVSIAVMELPVDIPVRELIVDGDHSGGRLYNDPSWTSEERNLNFNRTHQYYEAIAITPKSQHIEYPRPAFSWILSPPYADSGGMIIGENPAISVIEFFVTPFDELIWNNSEETITSDLSPGKIIGFDIVVYDHDSEPGEYHGVFSLSGESSLGAYADQFVDGILIGAEGDVPGGSAVESDTWARIKAGFRNW